MNRVNTQDRRAAEEWAMKMLDDPEGYQAALSVWLAAKPERRNLYDGLMRDIHAAGGAAAAAPLHSVQSGPVRRWLPLVVATIIGLVALAVIYPVQGNQWFSHNMFARTEYRSSISTGIGEVRVVQLADGSNITLDTNTLVQLDMAGSSRNLEIKHGRARFTVAHDAKRPFVVRAGGSEVIATGTVFDVTYTNTLAVNLLEGSVEVKLRSSQREDRKDKLLQLQPGQYVSLAGGRSALPSAIQSRRSDRQWVTGIKSLDDVPISEVIAEANRYSSTRIELSDASLGDRRIFGDIKIRNVHSVADAIADYLKLDIDASHAGKIILRAKI